VSTLVQGISPYYREELIRINYRDPGEVFFKMNPEIDTTSFDIANPVYNLYDTFAFSSQFQNETFNDISGVNVELWDTSNNTKLGNMLTIAGQVNFNVYFADTVLDGTHTYIMNLTHSYYGYPFTITESISVTFNDPTTGYLDTFTLYCDDPDQNINIYETFLLSGKFIFDGSTQTGVIYTLSNNQNGTTWGDVS
jgi:hypothetical protein